MSSVFKVFIGTLVIATTVFAAGFIQEEVGVYIGSYAEAFEYYSTEEGDAVVLLADDESGMIMVKLGEYTVVYFLKGIDEHSTICTSRVYDPTLGNDAAIDGGSWLVYGALPDR